MTQTAIVMTALEVEYQAVLAHLSAVIEDSHRRGTIYERGTFSANGRDWHVGIVQSGMGNSPTAAEAERMIEHFDPDVALFVGVGGGIKDVRLGDVVAATKVYGYHAGKAEPQFRPRTDGARSSYRLRERAKVVARQSTWRNRILPSAADGPDEPLMLNAAPTALIGAIAAGEQVVASTRSATYKLLRTSYSDALIVEMEGRGFLDATYINDDLPALIVRGTSDLIEDKEETDKVGWQAIASRHAAAFAFEVLANIDLPERQKRSAPPKPHIFQVPRQRNIHFTGRTDLLDKIYSQMKDRSRPTPIIQAIQGLGGIGKTQLAVEYIFRHAAEYDGVWWLPAESPELLTSGYSAIAEAVEIPIPSDLKPSAVTALVRQHLQTTAWSWLLVFDNAENPEQIQPYLPLWGNGRAIITSRNQVWSAIAAPLTIDVLTPDEAVAFLCSRTGLDDEVAAKSLSIELGCLPLALEQAAAFIAETGQTLAGYLALYRANPAARLAEDQPDPAHKYEATVAVTWDLSFRRVEEESAAAADLLRLCSVFGPEAIPFDLFCGHARLLPEPLRSALADQAMAERTAGAAKRYSLIDRHGERLAMHRLVQLIARTRLAEEGAARWTSIGVDILDEELGFEEVNPLVWDPVTRLIPHAIILANSAVEYNLIDSRSTSLLRKIGAFHWTFGNLAKAEEVLQRALTITGEAFGPQHPAVARVVSTLGSVEGDAGRLDSARAAHERALSIDRANYGEVHQSVAGDLNNLGLILASQGALDEAQSALEQALAIDRKLFGEEHRSVATVLDNLGLVSEHQEDFEAALAYREQALDITLRVYEADHPVIGSRLHNLGHLLGRLGDSRTAQSLLKEALVILEKGYGTDHPFVAVTQGSLGMLLRRREELELARPHLEAAIMFFERREGPESPHARMYRTYLVPESRLRAMARSFLRRFFGTQ